MSENKARLDNVARAITDALLDGPLYPYLAGKGSPGETACHDAIYAMARAALAAADDPDWKPTGDLIPQRFK